MKTVLITGASGGIAQELIKQLPSTYAIIAWGRSKSKLDNLYSDFDNVESYEIDICDEDKIKSQLKIIELKYQKIDILINNAGFGTFKTFDDYVQADIKKMFEVNTIAVMTISRLVGKMMRDRGQGHIFNIASMAGHIASQKASVYSASKFAVIGFSNALRLELADSGVIVTTVNPGPVKTDFFKEADPSGDYLKKIDAYTLEANTVARKIILSIGKKKRELNLPLTLESVHFIYKLFPKLSDFLARKVFNYK